MNANEAVDALEWPVSTWKKPGFLSTGSVGLDLALGGGWPRGAISELYGGEGSGKTTLAAQAALELRGDHIVTWIDTRMASGTPKAMTSEGHIIASARTDTRAMHILRTASESDLVVLDALEGLDVEHPDMPWNTHMTGLLARDLGQGDTTALILAGTYDYGGDGEYAINKAVRGRASTRVRLDVSLHREYADVTATVVKNTGHPLPEEPVTFRLQNGMIDHVRELVELAVKAGVITKKRSWYYLNGNNRVAQGLDKLVAELRDNSHLTESIERELKENNGSA